jgi:preprotein translocase subunit YajC
MGGMGEQLVALAQAEGGQPGLMEGCAQTLPFLLVIIAIFYFMVIRPQRKQQQEHQRFLDRLKEGDRVIMSSGILGRIVKLENDIVTLDVGDRTRIRFLRTQVQRPRPESAAEEPSSELREAEAKKKK